MGAKGTGSGPDLLLERDRELERLRAAVAAAAAGSGRLALISGPAGVGKTTLLQAAEREASGPGMTVLRARGDDLEREFPFGGAIQLFAEPVHERDAALLSGAAALARPLFERAEPALRPGDPDPAFPLLHGLHWLAVNLAEPAPLLLSVDDAQWIDPPTLRYLAYLLQRSEGLPLLIALAVRTGEPLDPAAEALLERLRAHPAGEVLELGALGTDAVRRIVTARIPDASDELAAACARASGGNPLLLDELLRAASAEGIEQASELRHLRPESIRSSVLVRLGRLGADAAALAFAAAVAGPTASVELLAAIAGLEPASAADAADALAAAEILEPTATGVAFVHPLIRNSIYEEIPPARRERLHGGAARLLHQRGAEPARVAAHLRQCGPLDEEWVVPALREAARGELAAGAPAAAAQHLERARAEPGHARDAELLLELGTAEGALGRPGALEHLEAAAEATEDPRAKALALGTLGIGRYAAADPHGAVEAAREALRVMPPGSGSEEAELLRGLALAGRQAREGVAAAREALAAPRLDAAGAPTAAEAARLAGLALFAVLEGRRQEAIESARAAIRLGRDERLGPAVSPIDRALAAGMLAFTGHFSEAEPVLDRAARDAERVGSLLVRAIALEARAWTRHVRGELRQALADGEVALEALGVSDAWLVASIPLRVGRVEALLERGELDAAEEALALPAGLEDAPPGTWAHIWLPRGRSRLAAARGEWKAALEQALTCGERAEAIEATSPEYMPWRSLAARNAVRAGDRAGAQELAAAELELAREIGSPWASGIALAALGAVKGRDGIEELREAVGLLDRSEAFLEQARSRLELGMALRRAGHRREARESLRGAIEHARRLGATAIMERAFAELRAAGGRPGRLELTGPEALTPSELRVAELAVQESTNREIAESLIVTLRTVETHLTHAYSKLGISSRKQLRGALGGERPG